VKQALQAAESLEIELEATPWADVHRAWALARASLRYADAIYVAAAERQHGSLLATDARIEPSHAPFRCQIITVCRPEQPHISPTPLAAGLTLLVVRPWAAGTGTRPGREPGGYSPQLRL
jgi:hypothetical protein